MRGIEQHIKTSGLVDICLGGRKIIRCFPVQAVGVGEVAVSDHRGSQIGCKDLAQIASQARVGGMLSGKAGLLYMHMGDGEQGLGPVLNAFESSDVPIEQVKVHQWIFMRGHSHCS